MNTTSTRLGTLFIGLLFFTLFSTNLKAQVNYTVKVTQVSWFEGGTFGNCWETGDEEFSALVWAFDDVNGAYQGGNCFTCTNNGNCTNSYNTQIASGTSTCAETITLRFNGWEDDSDGRCSYDSGDDCGCGPSNVATISFRNNGPGCTNYGSYNCNSDHNFRVQICWDYTENSICSRATPVVDGATAFNTTDICPEGDQNSCAGTGDTKALWYAYTASTTGTTVFETCGSSFDTSVSIFSDCNNTELACNDDSCGLQSSISLNTTCGTTYYVRVAGYGGASGTGILTITPPEPIAEAGTNKELCLGATYQIGGSPSASGTSGPYSYSWSPSTHLSSAGAANPTFTATALGTFIYTLQVTDVCGNTSTSDLITVSVVEEDVNSIMDYEICQDEAVPAGEGLEVTCSGSCNTGTGIAAWYNVPSGGMVLSNSSVFDPVTAGAVDNSIPGTYTFYVECICNDCVSDRVAVDFVVIEKPSLTLTPTDESCPGSSDGSITTFITGGMPPYSITWNISSNATSLSDLAAGTYAATVTDAKGCTVASSTVINSAGDNTPPVCVTQNLTVELSADGMASITANDVDNNSSDNCAITNRALDIMDFDCMNLGTNTVTFTATDGAGNSSICTATVTVQDLIAPMCATEDITVQLDANNMASITAADIDNGSSDNCGTVNNSIDISTFTYVNLGANIVTFTSTDGVGNSSICTATVTVEDGSAPMCVTQDIAVQLDVNGMASVTAADIDNGSSDNSGTVNTSIDITAFTCANIGANIVTFTATDGAGNSSICTATVTVQDLIAPMCATEDITVQLDANNMASITAADIDNGSSDNCGTVNNSIDISTFTYVNLGVNIVTFTSTDGVGNSSICTATVTVEDGSAPMCVTQDIAVQLDVNGMASVTAADIDNGSSDNSGTVNTSIDITAFTCANIGANIVTFTATDGAGNSSICTATVTVQDLIAPMCATEDITVQLDANNMASITAADIDNGSSDNCGTVNNSIDISTFTYVNLGANIVTFTSTDGVGNSSICTATVTVEDGSAPMCVTQDIAVQLDVNGMASVTAADIDNGSSDNSGTVNTSIDITAFTCANIGANIVTFTATDGAGNSSICTATVTVQDLIAPMCATEDITVQLDANNMASITAADIDNGSSDNCGTVNNSIDISTFTYVNLGANIVTFTSTDGVGNSSICTATVTVEDGSAPMCVTQDIAVQLDVNGMASVTAADIDNGSSDNSGTVNTSIDITAFTCANIGANIVTFTATDGAGNSSICTATVTVQDLIAPMCATEDITVQLDANNMASITAADIDNGSSDNCGTVNNSIDISTFTYVNLGVNIVTFTSTDGVGNSSICTATVTVEDGSAPMCVTQDIAVQLDVNGMASVTAADIDNGSSDNSGTVNTSIDITAFTCANIGANIVTFTATDGAGNSSICTATVTVQDLIAPMCAAEDITIQIESDGITTITGADVATNSSDNCGIQSITLDQMDFDCGHIGNNTVILTVTDMSNNNSSCAANVYVEPTSCGTCDDGIQNGQETGLDCGGPTCPVCPVCTVSQYYSGAILSGIYQTSSTIGTNALIFNTENVSLLAGTICLDPDFEVQLGAEFLANPVPCTAVSDDSNATSLQTGIQSNLAISNNGTIQMTYFLQTKGKVEFRIESIDGSFKQQFFDEEKQSGEHLVQITPTALKSGVYSLVLITEKGKRIERIVMP